MSSDAEFLESLKKDFLDEASFLLEQCEESYLKLEEPANRVEELGRIFRMAHSMKGAGAAVGFTDLAGFAHKVEDCLTLLRAYPERVDTDAISILLQAGDAFKSRVAQLRAGNSEVWQIQTLTDTVLSLKARIESRQAAPSQTAQLAEQTVALTTGKPPATTAAPGSPPASTSLKIDSERVDAVLNLVGELVILKSQVMDRCARYHTDLRLTAVLSLMDKGIRELQDRTLSMRMTPLKPLFLKNQRLIRDLSLKLGKAIEFKMFGEETEIDRTMVELLADPLMHMVRNSLDHGIEPKEKRLANGKPEKGTIYLTAYQAGGRIRIEIKDDGGGIPKDKILKKGIEKGLVPASADLSTIADKDVFALIFAPGFSTAEKVTDVSGRGVGMDVVKTNIERLRGEIEIQSVLGKGTTFTISVPLTTSITDGMTVRISEETFVIPIESIVELFPLNAEKIVTLKSGHHALQHRDTVVPILRLRELFSEQAQLRSSVEGEKSVAKDSMVALIQSGSKPVALVVDEVLSQAQVVLKPLDSGLTQSVAGLSGACILGDGRVALVVDPLGLGDTEALRGAA